jgi:hypothetical protein
MWYNQMKEFLINKGYYNNDDCPYVFIRKPSTGFCIISVFVDDLNIIGSPTIIYEDNATCIAQMQSGYMKSNVTKHIASKLFYSHKLRVNGEINILQTKSCDNLVDLFNKFLPYCIFSKCVAGIDMRQFRDLHDLGGALS